jgi:NADP-dependent 3-hydroxy acid dehydrogenase YdfG
MRRKEKQVVLITGCSSGIGKALAKEFAADGHHVIATARRLDSVEDLVGDGAHILELDVTDKDSITKAVIDSHALFGRIDIVVNNAGYALIGPIAELELDDLRTQFETNVVGVVAVIQEVVPKMVERGSGRIVNIGSVSGVAATPFGGAYCGTKAAIHLLSDALRMELAPFGIRVTTVQPGAIESDFGATAAHGIERYRDGSLYSGVFDSIESRAGASQVGSMPAAIFAREVVDAVTAPSPPAVFRAGKHSMRLPVLGHLPARIRDRIFSKRFGLDRLAVG